MVVWIHLGISLVDIKSHTTAHYAGLKDLDREVASIPFEHFGLVIDYPEDALLAAFDETFVLRPELKSLIAQYGVLIFRNVHLDNPGNAVFQKNIFGHLEFHVDRGLQFDNQYSLFYRDPNDPEHRLPRRTSSLICPNAVIHLQANREGLKIQDRGTLQRLFIDGSPHVAIGTVILEQSWQAPPGTGEVCVFDNRTVMHASYHPGETRGYKIAVQYLY
ncbi:MAG: hypothetical protein O3A84_15250 [Proteobacteria bacterium]|nr:hypothetical protein [Pseudomonadota bacterium]